MKNHAFTLVELLVVIAVVAVLIAMLMPALGKAREVTNRVVCAAQLRQCSIGVTSYATDYAGAFPQTTYHKRVDINTSGGMTMAMADRDVHALDEFIENYLGKSLRTFVCPTSGSLTQAKNYVGPLFTHKSTPNENLFENGTYFWIGGALAFNGMAISDPRYSSFATIGSVFDPLAVSPTAQQAGYLKQRQIDSAKCQKQWINGAFVNVTSFQPPSKITLFGDFNYLRTSIGFIGHHMVSGLTSAPAVTTSLNYITGMNEVMADGHSVWADYDATSKTTHWQGNFGAASGGMLTMPTDR